MVAERAVLVVDNDPQAAYRIVQTLRGHGYHTVVAADGSEVCPILELTPVDLVILELVMSGMNGWEVIRRLRPRFWPTFSPVQPACKIIAVCGRADEDTVAFVRHLGADAFLRKPVSPAALLRTVHSLLGAEAVLPSPPKGAVRHRRSPAASGRDPGSRSRHAPVLENRH